MSVLYLLIPLAILFGALFVVAFIWATRKGQFDDLDGAAYRALEDEPPVDPNPSRGKKAKSSPAK